MAETTQAQEASSANSKQPKTDRKQKLRLVFKDKDGNVLEAYHKKTAIMELTDGERSVPCDLRKINKDVLHKASMFGLQTAIRNRGNSALAAGQDWHEAAAERVELFEGPDGEWSAKRESTGPRKTILVKALARVKGLDDKDQDVLSKITASIDEMEDSAGWKREVAKLPKIKAAVAQIKLEEAEAAVASGDDASSDALLGNLGV